jgi:hypothetical protein
MITSRLLIKETMDVIDGFYCSKLTMKSENTMRSKVKSKKLYEFMCRWYIVKATVRYVTTQRSHPRHLWLLKLEIGAKTAVLRGMDPPSMR